MRLALGALASAFFCAAGALVFAGCASDEVNGTVVVDAAPEASALDASVADTFVPEDAADDVVEDHAPHTTFCSILSNAANPPKFCDDFDDHDVANGWSTTTVSPTTDSTLADDSTQFVSAPLSAVFKTKALATGAGANASLRATLITAVNHPSLQFQARFSQTAFTDGSVAIATLNVSLSHLFYLYLHDPLATPPGPSLYEEVPVAGASSMKVHHPLTGVLPAANTWADWTIALDFDAGTASVSYDGVALLTNEPIQKVAGTEATIRIGAVYMTGPLPAFTANFDNVVLDY